MKHKFFSYGGKKVYLEASSYQNGGGLAVCMMSRSGELYDVITVNLPDGVPSDTMAFLDTNNHPDIEKFIRDNDLGQPTGLKMRSGFCAYPLYILYTSNF